MAKPLRDCLSFGFEQTFTIPEWWTDPGFVATSDTPLKRACMLRLSEQIALVLKGSFKESKDIYGHLQYETFDSNGQPSFVVTMDPGSIEVKTQPCLQRDVQALLEPLFEAAERADVKSYRSWWYGVRGGTEGGCHVNMGGFDTPSNPLYQNPSLVLKYAAYYHNHPELHFPFMGVDVGPGGNCMRMDEHPPHSRESLAVLSDWLERLPGHEVFEAGEIHQVFKGTLIADDKHSAPSLYKFKAPLFLLEDRAVEAFRSAEDGALISLLRLKIFEHLEGTLVTKLPQKFGAELHREYLCSTFLWQEFKKTAVELGLDPAPYARFFERQFPRLEMGDGPPARLKIHEGRKPRVIKSVQMRGDLIISKQIDTRFGRLEIHWTEGDFAVRVNGITVKGRTLAAYTGERESVALVDYCVDEAKPGLWIELLNSSNGQVIENCFFNLKDKLFAVPTQAQMVVPTSGDPADFILDTQA